MNQVLFGLILFFMSLTVSHPSWSAGAKALKVACFDAGEQIPALVINDRSFYAESPVRFEDALYYVEFSKDRVMKFSSFFGDPRGGAAGLLAPTHEVLWSEAGCGPAAVMPFDGGFYVACYSSHKLVYLSATGQKLSEVLSPVGAFAGATPPMAPNDFVSDAFGGFYFTSSGEFNASQETPIAGRVFYFSSRGDLHEVASGIHYSNGIALSAAGDTLLVAEHLKNRIRSYRVVAPGVLDSEFKIFADLQKLFPWKNGTPSAYLGPDGMRLNQGVLFIAQYAGSRILKMREDGTVIGSIDLRSDFPNTTNIWVDHNHLYITAVRDDSAPGSHAVYPAIVLRIADLKLTERAHLVCEIK
jgi:sugar lactone lactonase YvrE